MIPHFLELMTHPEHAWEEIRQDEDRNSFHYLPHLLLLALIPAISLFIGTTRVGWSLVEDERVMLTTMSAFQLSALLYLTIMLGTLLMGWFIRWMSRTFDSRPTFNQCVGFMAYIATPYFIAGLAALYPSRWLALAVLLLASGYATFLLYVGLPRFMRIGNEQAFPYASSIWGVGLLVLVTILVSMILHWQYVLLPDYERPTIQDQAYPTQDERPQ
ncbi:YIP1 family protein [Pseudomonas sp. PIC25]|uniref:Yip1 family protein n=1 Tax=Pseudomonas sp. PIC25 TaxID=1958773 RepID=UPI000BAB4C09|nr:Yip1 family protein [Pseudomonas sp. PIC25]PAU51149.1 YIP1 family protein [Pseudomonas sp. PIC25]